MFTWSELNVDPALHTLAAPLTVIVKAPLPLVTRFVMNFDSGTTDLVFVRLSTPGKGYFAPAKGGNSEWINLDGRDISEECEVDLGQDMPATVLIEAYSTAGSAKKVQVGIRFGQKATVRALLYGILAALSNLAYLSGDKKEE